MGTHLARVNLDKATEIVLGEGKVIVGHTTEYSDKKLPALSFSRAPRQGTPGEDFNPEGRFELAEGAVILVFANKEAVFQHLERLNMLVHAIQASQT